MSEPESVTEPESDVEQTTTPGSKVNCSKFHPEYFIPAAHIAPALQPAKPLTSTSTPNSCTKNLAIGKRSNLKREATSSPKVRGNNDKENVPPRPSKHRRVKEPSSSLSCEVRSLRYVVEEENDT
ncbi:hypothetical protein M422DRAFT_250227 [Sphaerobolus stellatus SS14]|uniref:Uncharacterized protein n=1 Tax=Sphaerobolus stellatus (strain SS14) TaxID=990650 RepID=A0A0C9W366_SPHS4|nr:hypothetical protein M422DRAFT_250227 [Sphaerobolus stellatus SS14]